MKPAICTQRAGPQKYSASRHCQWKAFTRLAGIGALLVCGHLSHAATEDKLSAYQAIDWSQYTVEAIRARVPESSHQSDVESLLSARLYFTGPQNLLEMQRAWKKNGIDTPKTIVVANGVYEVADLYHIIADEQVIAKTGDRTYLFRQPIYVTPTASLVIRDVSVRLSVLHGTFLMADGELYVVDSTITSWNENTNDEGAREHIPAQEILLYGRQTPRPYILMAEGSQLYMANSLINGLGYKGQRGTFGISLSKRAQYPTSNLNTYIRQRPRPTGWLIGNTFTNNFFGFYSIRADDIVIVGNVYHDNVIYNIDPHDYSNNLLIARNLTYNAQHAHGIIISREVDHAVIAENISASNNGTGIMLERNSEDTLVYSNISLNNKGDGIAVFESDHNLLANNIAARNQNNGIHVRNSDHITVIDNFILRNANNGAETAVLDIDDLETRNFELDPYHKSASARYSNNRFDSNVNAAMAAKNNGKASIYNNIFYNSGPVIFADDLEPHTATLLKHNQEGVLLSDPAGNPSP